MSVKTSKKKPAKRFDKVYAGTRKAWQEKLSVVEVEDGSEEEKHIFYTSFYHMQIHPNIFYDVNGEYPDFFQRKNF